VSDEVLITEVSGRLTLLRERGSDIRKIVSFLRSVISETDLHATESYCGKPLCEVGEGPYRCLKYGSETTRKS
jgi:hypothetical protein